LKKYYLLLLIISLSFFFCKGEKETELAQQSPPSDHHHEEHTDIKVPLSKQKQWGIKIGEVSAINISSKINLPGVISLNQNKTAHISSLVPGKIVSLLTDLGDRVSQGQRLLVLNSPQFSTAKAEFFQSKTNLDLKQKEYERAKILLEQKAIEKKEFLRREAEFSEALIRYDVAKCNLRSLGFSEEHIKDLLQKCELLNDISDSTLNDPYLSIISPLSGKIIFREAMIGQHIEPDKILFTVSDLSTVWAILDAYEKDLPYINKDSSVTIKTSLYPNKVFKGKISYISDEIDEKLRTVKLRVIVRNEGYLLKPNMFIMGILENKDETQKLLCVPEEAVQNMNGKKIVFLQEEKDIFVPKEVKIAENIDNKLIITEGLKLGQPLVIKGAFYLKTELNKESFGEAHVH